MTDYKEGDIFRIVREELAGDASESFTLPSVNHHIGNVGRQLYARFLTRRLTVTEEGGCWGMISIITFPRRWRRKLLEACRKGKVGASWLRARCRMCM